MSGGETPRAVNIARCPKHGLHGERSECFVCGGPVEQEAMVEKAPVDAERERMLDLLERVIEHRKAVDSCSCDACGLRREIETFVREHGRLTDSPPSAPVSLREGE